MPPTPESLNVEFYLHEATAAEHAAGRRRQMLEYIKDTPYKTLVYTNLDNEDIYPFMVDSNYDNLTPIRYMTIQNGGKIMIASDKASIVFNDETIDEIRLINCRVIVGDKTPLAPFHVVKSVISSTNFTNECAVAIEGNSQSYIEILTPNNSYSGIRFSDPDGYGRGTIEYLHSSDSMNFYAGSVSTLSLYETYLNLTTKMSIGASAGFIPDCFLHLYVSDCGTFTAIDGAALLIEASQAARIEFATPNTEIGIISFSDPDNHSQGIVAYDHNLDKLYFQAAGFSASEFAIRETYASLLSKMTIGDSTSPDTLLHLKNGVATGTTDVTGTLLTLEAGNSDLYIHLRNITEAAYSGIVFSDDFNVDVARIVHSRDDVRIEIGKTTPLLVGDDGSVVVQGTLACASGATINEFSIDGTLAGNSDTAVPTEKAVKSYVNKSWADYGGTSIVVGWSSLGKTINYKLIGDILFVRFIISGTSNSDVAVFSLPYTIRLLDLLTIFEPCFCVDNGSSLTTPSSIVLENGSSTITVNKVYGTNNGWTASGTKTIQGNFWVPVDL